VCFISCILFSSTRIFLVLSLWEGIKEVSLFILVSLTINTGVVVWLGSVVVRCSSYSWELYPVEGGGTVGIRCSGCLCLAMGPPWVFVQAPLH